MAIIKVRVKQKCKCYYGERIHKEGNIVDFNTGHMSPLKRHKGTALENKKFLPSWAEVVKKGDVERFPEPPKFVPTTLHEVAKSGGPKVNSPAGAKNLADEQRKLNEDRDAFEKEKKEFEESKNKENDLADDPVIGKKQQVPDSLLNKRSQ